MQSHFLSKYALITVLLLAMGACSGSGSGPNPFDELGVTGEDGSNGDGSNSGDAVSITITSPASGGTLETPDETVALAGTADSNASIVSVSWTSDKGGKGAASGSESWETAPIPLLIGDNTITITAEDGTGATASRTVIIKREGEGGQVTLAWQAPTAREDNSPLVDLAGYYIHYGRMSETYDYEIKVENPGIASYVVDNLSSGTWYFVARAYDSRGLVSDLSNEIRIKIP
jgi:hypothetical protein